MPPGRSICLHRLRRLGRLDVERIANGVVAVSGPKPPSQHTIRGLEGQAAANKDGRNFAGG